MRGAGLVVARTLARVLEHVRPGVTTRELDRVAEESIRGEGATPSFLGYHGFPASICASPGDRVVHGIPDDVPLPEGVLLSVDCGAVLEGWHGDAAVSVPVGACADECWRCRRSPSSRSGPGCGPAGPEAGCPTSGPRCSSTSVRTATGC